MVSPHILKHLIYCGLYSTSFDKRQLSVTDKREEMQRMSVLGGKLQNKTMKQERKDINSRSLASNYISETCLDSFISYCASPALSTAVPWECVEVNS